VAAGQGCCQVTTPVLRFRYAATGRWAVSIRTYLAIVFPFGFISAIEREQLQTGSNPTDAVTIALAGELAACLYLFVAQIVVLGNRKLKQQPLWRCIFVWVSTGFVRGGFALFYEWQTFDLEGNPSVHLIPAVLYTSVAMAMSAFYFGRIAQKRLEVQALRSLGQLLIEQRSQLELLEDQKRRQLISTFEKQLLPQVSLLQSEIQRLRGEWVAVPQQLLQQLLEQSYKISQSILSKKEEYAEIDRSSIKEHSPQLSKTLWLMLAPNVFSPPLTFFLILLGAVIGQFPRNGIVGMAAGFIAATVIASFLFPISLYIRRGSKNRKLLILLGFLGTFSLSTFFTLLQPSLGFQLNYPFPAWYLGLKSVYGVYLASVITTLLIQTRKEYSGAKGNGSKLKKVVRELIVIHEIIDKSLFETHFGSLQGKIAGVTMALHLMNSQEMDQIEHSRKEELLESANSLLGECIITIKSLAVNQT